MRKVIYPRTGGVDSIEIVECPEPVPGPKQVRIDSSCGDILRRPNDEAGALWF